MRPRPRGLGPLPGEETLELAHLSDLHVRPGDQQGLELVAKALGRPEVARAGLVVISGDLTDSGSESELASLEGLLASHGLKGRTLLVPGNHDTGSDMYRLLSPADHHRPRRQRAESLLALAKAYMPGAQALGHGGRWPLSLSLHNGRVVVFALDSSGGHQRAPLFSRGRLGREQLAALEKGLKALSPWQAAVLVLHHHPLPMPVGRRPQDIAYLDSVMALGDRRRLVELIRRHNVRLVLHGHRHCCFQQALGRAKVLQAGSPTRGCSLSGRRVLNLVRLGLTSLRARAAAVDFAPPAHLRLLSKVSFQQEEWRAWLGALSWREQAARGRQGPPEAAGWWTQDLWQDLDRSLMGMLERVDGGPWRPGGMSHERA